MSYHPDEALLKHYALGEVDATQGLALAVHLESCPRCRHKVATYERALGDAFLTQSGDAQVTAPLADDVLDTMFDSIVALPQHEESTVKLAAKPKKVCVNNRTFILPKALAAFHDRIGPWRSYGGKVFSAVVDLDEPSRVNLMYMAPGVTVPQHTHKGLESTLVLHGGFSDEDGHYEVGDFLLKDASVKHSPATASEEDCLCLSVLTEPMLFTQGVARLFNMFGKGLYP